MQMNNIQNTMPVSKITKADIKETTDYEMFKGVIGNRGVYNPHLRRLRRSIEQKNMLAQNPIIVNQNLEVIDGQHRLLAAQELGIPIYYMVVKDASLMEIQLLNANNRAWFTQDYLDSYIAMGKKDYIQLQEFANEYRISVSIAMQILADSYNRHAELLREFREGNFRIKDYKKAENMASLVSEIRRHSPDIAWAHKPCISALAHLLEKTDPKILTEQLERYQVVITRRPSVKDYLRQFENIINTNKEGKQVFLV